VTSRERGVSDGDAGEVPRSLLSTDDRVLLELARGTSRARDIAWVLAQVQKPSPDEWVLDPACGGVILLAALDVARELHGATAALTLVGVELDPRTAAIARASLVLAGAHPDQFWIGTGNALAQPLVGFDRRSGHLQPLRCTLSLANPPFGKAASRDARHDDGPPLVVPDRVLYRPVPCRRQEP
jgi:type I restriction-modification system DNA methylase subunit